MTDVIADFLADTTPNTGADVVVDDGIERDRYGRYLIPNDDDPKKKTPHTRATTLAKTLSDTYGLELWGKRMTAIGLTRRADLYARVAACDPDDRKALNGILEEAQEAAAATVGRNLGTALHSFTERLDLGEDVSSTPAPWDADLKAYTTEMRRLGVTVVPGMIEKVVVVKGLKIAGTFDRLLQVPRLGPKPKVGDLKTAKELYDLGEIAMQLALYAHADAIFDPRTGQCTRMPDVDQDVAIVMHLPPGQARCTLLVVDIAAGWEAVQHATWTREWRNRSKKLGTLLEDMPNQGAAGGVEQLLGPSKNATVATDLEQLLDPPATNGTTALEPEAPAPEVDELEAMLAAKPPGEHSATGDDDGPRKISLEDFVGPAVAMLGQRLKAAVEAGCPAMHIRWPAGVPTFKQGGPTTWAQVLEVERCVLTAEKEIEAPFYDPLPSEPGPLGPKPTAPLYDDEPVGEKPAKAGAPAAAELDRLRQINDSLPFDLQVATKQLCVDHDVPSNPANWTTEHATIVDAALRVMVSRGVARVQALEQIAASFDEPSMLAALKQAARVDVDLAATGYDELQAERLTAVARASEVGHLTFEWTDEIPTVVLTTAGDVALTRSFKNKTELVNTAKTAAARHGLQPPRSAAQVATDVALVALVLYGPDEDEPTTKESNEGEQP